MKNVVVFTGAGVSAESGISTFRDHGGLWEKYKFEDVATTEAWIRQPKIVLEFYNARRKEVIQAKPNRAHELISKLQSYFNTWVITQNIDNLHERAGSKNVMHLHGEIMKSKSSINPNIIYDVKNGEIKWGDLCELGSQIRPHVVWFGEEVPLMPLALQKVSEADILIITGTSLQVYPAAGIIFNANKNCEIFLIDPGEVSTHSPIKINRIKEKAGKGMEMLFEKLKLD